MAISKAVIEGRKARVPARKTATYELSKKVSLDVMLDNLKNSVNTRRASSCTFLWSGERLVKKQELDLRQMNLVIEEIQALGMTVEQLANTEAKWFLMPEMIDNIINGYRNKIEIAKKLFLARLDEIDDIGKDRKLDLDKKEAEINRMDTETYILGLKGEAEADAIRAGTEEARVRVSLLTKLRDEMDFNNISPSQAFVLAKGLTQIHLS
jgi:hypothetical protein